MVSIFRIRRRAVGGAAGAPASLASAELAMNEQDNVLYYGKGNSGGNATSIIPIAGPGLTASQTQAGLIEHATDAELRAATAGNYAVTAAALESAAAFVAITDAATLAVDWDTGINFITTIAGNRVVGNPTNGQVGTYRTYYITGNDATARTITWSSFFKGDVPVITDCSSAKQYLFTMFCVNPASHFLVTALRAL
jgi:hypothetical protein